MPVILRKETERQWIDDDIQHEKLLSLLSPCPAHLMRMYEVFQRVNRTSKDSPEIIKSIH